jgi:hypothetical protein
MIFIIIKCGLKCHYIYAVWSRGRAFDSMSLRFPKEHLSFRLRPDHGVDTSMTVYQLRSESLLYFQEGREGFRALPE